MCFADIRVKQKTIYESKIRFLLLSYCYKIKLRIAYIYWWRPPDPFLRRFPNSHVKVSTNYDLMGPYSLQTIAVNCTMILTIVTNTLPSFKNKSDDRVAQRARVNLHCLPAMPYRFSFVTANVAIWRLRNTAELHVLNTQSHTSAEGRHSVRRQQRIEDCTDWRINIIRQYSVDTAYPK